MLLPATYLSGLLLMVLALICTGAWTSLYKTALPYRYELFNFDLAIGVVVLAVVAAVALGATQSGELTVEDNILITGYRLMAWALAAGFIFNLGNVILLSAISVGGISIAFPVAFGVALMIDAVLDFFGNPRLNPMLLFGGATVILIAVVLFIVAHFRHRAAMALAAKKTALQLDPRSREAKEAKKRARTVPPGGVAALAIISGILLAFPPRLLSMARETEVGLGPYGLMLFFAAGFFISTLLYSPFLLTFPVGGSPARVGDYLRGGFKAHLLGILAGMMLCGGILAVGLVIGTPAFTALGGFSYNLLYESAPLLAVLCGALLWGELGNEGQSARPFLWSGFLLYAVGLGLIAFAPEYGAR
jgi:glucose uptake protein